MSNKMLRALQIVLRAISVFCLTLAVCELFSSLLSGGDEEDCEDE